MDAVTFNTVRDGVISTLAKNFPTMDVYGEEIKQSLDPPCFFVKLLDSNQDKDLDRRYKRYHSFDIHFFDEEKKNRTMHDIAEQLYNIMEMITFNNQIFRGTKMRHEVINDVLHFFVDYNFRVVKQKPAGIKMKTLEQEGFIRD